MVFDGVFCIFSTKEVTRSGLILPNCITLFLFLFSVLLFAVVSRGSDEGAKMAFSLAEFVGF